MARSDDSIRPDAANAAPREDVIFRALADPTRRHLLDSLNTNDGQNLRSLSREVKVTRQTVSKHLAVLEAANIVTPVRLGRERLHYLNPLPIVEGAGHWVHRYDREAALMLAEREANVNATADSHSQFLYTTYILTSVEQLWRALTDPDVTEQWWKTSLHSEWSIGSPMTWRIGSVTIDDREQRVLDVLTHHRLAYTWHTFTRELGELHGFSEQMMTTILVEPRSWVQFTLEPHGPSVKLTLEHTGFEPESVVLALISQGWPQLVSSLKTLLETGAPLPWR